MKENYDDIIHLPHHVSKKRTQMSMMERAAQFAPFAALTGHNAAIAETARLTDSAIALEESDSRALNDKFTQLLAHIQEEPKASFTHFVADDKKSGGKYVMVEGRLKKYDEYHQTIQLTDGTVIALRDVLEIEINSEE